VWTFENLNVSGAKLEKPVSAQPKLPSVHPDLSEALEFFVRRGDMTASDESVTCRGSGGNRSGVHGPENDDPEADEVEDEAKGTSHADDMKSPPKERKKKRPTFAFVNDSSYQRRRVYGSTNVNKRNEKPTSSVKPAFSTMKNTMKT
jgi:hypothetical protein